MKEDLLSYIWRYRLWGNKELATTDGKPIEIIDVGTINKDAGPDYFNAKIKIDDTIWAGNVELHICSSDWNRHRHQYDPAYNNIILHVVQTADTTVQTENGQCPPQLELNVEQKYINLANELNQNEQAIPCGHYWDEKLLERLQLSLNGLLCERLEHKVERIVKSLEKNKNDWEETFYQQLAQSMGMKVNEFPFLQLTLSLPLKYLGKHKNNLLQVEAMIMGQAGLLEKLPLSDPYIENLKNEYKFFRAKFNLLPIDSKLWKFARMRPANSPYIRLAELAMMIHKSESLFSKIIETRDFKKLHECFTYGTSDYWDTHYSPNQESPSEKKIIGKTLRNSILINCVAPMVFCYGKMTGNDVVKDYAFELLEKIPAESNNIITTWCNYGAKPQSAYDTQALIELKKFYCDRKDCLRCKLGIQVFKKVCGNK